jgi:hypothetical protein
MRTVFYVLLTYFDYIICNRITEGLLYIFDRLCGLVVRVLDYKSGGPGSISGTTRFSGGKKKENK